MLDDQLRVLGPTTRHADHGHNEQNLSLSWTLARDHDAHRPVAVTSDYHAFRAAQIATELGLPTDVVGARTASYYYPSAVLREFVGVLARRPLAYGLTGLLLAALPASVTLLVLAASSAPVNLRTASDTRGA